MNLSLRWLLTCLFLLGAGCAYRFGLSDRRMPGGYTEVTIPVFKNLTPVVGIETEFTNALIERFARSQVAQVSNGDRAPVQLEGTITRVDIIPGAAERPSTLTTLPTGTALVNQYRLVVTTSIVVRRRSDEKVLWEGSFLNEKSYLAPLIGTALANSANPTYNHSARMNLYARMAEEMMTEAHDRMTENF